MNEFRATTQDTAKAEKIRRQYLNSESNKKIEQKFTNKFLVKDGTSHSGYNLKTGKFADAVVRTYKKIEKKFTDTFLEAIPEEKNQSEKINSHEE